MPTTQKPIDYQLVNTLVQLDGLNSNSLITSDGIHPSHVAISTTLSTPLSNIHDVAVLSMFYTNEHNHITSQNNSFRITVEIAAGDVYYADVAVPPGNYTTELIEMVLYDATSTLGDAYKMKKVDDASPNLIIDFSAPDVFQLEGFVNLIDTGHTVIKLPIPNGATLSVIQPNFQHSLASSLGFVQNGIDKVRIKNIGGKKAVMSLRSIRYANLLNDHTTFHLASNSISQILEHPPSANALGKQNIICTVNTTTEALEPILFDNSAIEQTRMIAKQNSELSKIDLQLLDNNFTPVSNNTVGNLSVTLLIRTTKRLVVAEK